MPQKKPDNLKSHDMFLDEQHVFEAPGVSGRMNLTPLSGGGFLYRSEFKASEDCELNYLPFFKEPWIGSAFHIQGHSVMKLKNGQEYKLDSEHAALLRVDKDEVAFRLKKDVLIRHVGVSMGMKDLQHIVGNTAPKHLSEFKEPFGQACMIKPIVPSQKMQKLASSLFASNMQGLFYQLKLEGVASLFLAECLEQLCQPSRDKNKLSVIESQVHKQTTEYIHNNLSQPISIERLAEQHDTNSNRLNWIFKQQSGISVADLIRNERLRAAHRLLLESPKTVKEIAAAVGYYHTGNFSRAYKRKFGEAPSRTQKNHQQ